MYDMKTQPESQSSNRKPEQNGWSADKLSFLEDYFKSHKFRCIYSRFNRNRQKEDGIKNIYYHDFSGYNSRTFTDEEDENLKTIL